MCVNAKGYDWERPATVSDCKILAGFFPGVDFEGLLQAMSQDEAVPLTSDIALMGAMIHTAPDKLGMRYVPFSALEHSTRRIVKLPVMEQIVEWFENTALGTDMWKNASDWCEKRLGMRVHFAMNCGCGLVSVTAYKNGQWAAWKRTFNRGRADIFGRTIVTHRQQNIVDGLDITKAQLDMWHLIRASLEALPAAAQPEEERLAA